MEFLKKNAAGIAICFLIAAPAWLLVRALPALEVIGAPVIAILAGMIGVMFCKELGACKPGVAFTSKKILQLAVVLLGFGLNLATIGKVGMASLPIIVSTISISLVVAWVMHKIMHTPAKISTLLGVGSSICGGSAIAATAPVIGADDEEIAQSISVIFLFNVLAALIFPSLGGVLGLSNEGFGLFAGTAVNDTSSVTAAASTWDTLHGTGGLVLEYATIVKLTRTLAIIPITLVLAFRRMKDNGKGSQERLSLKSVFPMFILYFVLASVVTTAATSLLTGAALAGVNGLFSVLKQLSKFFIVMAMAAIGLNTDLVKLVKTGGKPILMGFCCWIAIITVSLAMQRLMGTW